MIYYVIILNKENDFGCEKTFKLVRSCVQNKNLTPTKLIPNNLTKPDPNLTPTTENY